MGKEIKTRDQVEEQFTWDLSDIYENKAAWEADVEAIMTEAKEIANFSGRVMESADTLLEVMNRLESMEMKVNKAFEYASRLHDQDTGNAEHQAMSSQIFSVYAASNSEISFIDPEIIAAGQAKVEEYKKTNPALEKYAVQFKGMFRLEAHTLSAEMEALLASVSETAGVPSDAFGMLSNADLEFPVVKNHDGEDERITHGNYYSFMLGANREVRKNAYHALYGTYEKYLNTFASLYFGQVKQQIFYAKARKYDSTLECAVDGNDVPSSVYKNLVETVGNHLDSLHKYTELRKKKLGYEELHPYDQAPSLFGNVDKKVTYDEACATMLKALAPLGEDYLEVVERSLKERWIDVYENKGKRSGAYSAGGGNVHPYMLLNYTDTFDDMFTLVHEMGHSLHTYLSSANQSFMNSQYVIFVAEVASTCNEILLLEYLMKNCQDEEEKAYLLNHYIDMFKGTVFRQTQFAEYEMVTNAMAEEGTPLTAEILCKTYGDINKKYYGEALTEDKEISYEWARIPHFYYNFYVYQYATSFCAAVAIAHNILEEGAPAVERYKKFLSGGCSQSPIDLLKIAGVDLSTPAPIDAALNIFDGLIEELEKLI